ncbi:MAG: PilZ domain-containing protein [Smithella sp.]
MEHSSKKTDILYQNDEDKKNQIQIGRTPISDGKSAANILPQILNLDISNHQVISEAETISQLLKKISEQQTPVYIKSNSSSDAFPFMITSIDALVCSHICLKRSIQTDDYDFSGYNELIIFFHDQLTFYTFKTTVLNIERDMISVALPYSIMQLWRRSHPKSRINLESQNINAKVLVGENEEYAFPVNDIAYRGISLNLPNRDTAKVMENAPVKININIDNTLDISFEASLKYMAEALNSKTMKCGFEITGIDADKKEKLKDHIFRHNYPYIVPFHVKYLDKIWDLFFKSGYMIPEKADYVKKNKRNIEDTWARLYDEKSKIGKMLLFMDNNELYGTVAAAKAYDNTWMLHQVAGLKHPEVKIGQYILDSITIQTIEYLDIDNVKAYFRKENSWAIKKFFKFREFCTLKESILYTFQDLYEIDMNQYKYFKSGNLNVEIEYLSSEEDRLFITDYLTKTLPELLQITESINNDGLNLPKTSEAYSNIGLFRGRKILIAKENKKIISFALLEYGSTGINIGGLLDVFQIFTVDPFHENINIINRVLINEIIYFYHSIKKTKALCFADDTNKRVLEDAGLTKKLDYIMWHFKNDSFKQVLRYFSTAS